MKTLPIKLSAMLMVLWYSMSVIGFDVHTCSGSGKSFIATFISGTGCEDIHPDHVCGKGTCQIKAHHEGCCDEHRHSCAHDCCEEGHDGLRVRPQSCCTDDYHVIMLTGVPSDDDEFRYEATCLAFCPFLDLSAGSWNADSQGLTAFLRSVRQPDVRKDFQAVMNIWRI